MPLQLPYSGSPSTRWPSVSKSPPRKTQFPQWSCSLTLYITPKGTKVCILNYIWSVTVWETSGAMVKCEKVDLYTVYIYLFCHCDLLFWPKVEFTDKKYFTAKTTWSLVGVKIIIIALVLQCFVDWVYGQKIQFPNDNWLVVYNLSSKNVTHVALKCEVLLPSSNL